MGPSCHDRIGISRVEVQCIKGLRRNCYFSILRLWKLQTSCFSGLFMLSRMANYSGCSQRDAVFFCRVSTSKSGLINLVSFPRSPGDRACVRTLPSPKKNREERVFSSLRFSWGKREGGGRGRCTQANSVDSLPDFFWGEGGVCTQTLGTRLLGHAV